jgi:hypothetical protein
MQLRPRRLGLLRDPTATGFRVPVIVVTGRSNEEAYLEVFRSGRSRHCRASRRAAGRARRDRSCGIRGWAVSQGWTAYPVSRRARPSADYCALPCVLVVAPTGNRLFSAFVTAKAGRHGDRAADLPLHRRRARGRRRTRGTGPPSTSRCRGSGSRSLQAARCRGAALACRRRLITSLSQESPHIAARGSVAAA